MTHIPLALLARLVAAACGAVTVASCAQPPKSRPAESVRLATELRALVGQAPCQASAQCRSLAVGHKPCGGPSGYLAWSVSSTDTARLTELAARQAQAERLEQQASGLLSNCALVADPGAVCVAGRCQLGSPSSPAAAQ